MRESMFGCAQIAKDIHAVNDEQHLGVALQV
jgi:hypothetical protein